MLVRSLPIILLFAVCMSAGYCGRQSEPRQHPATSSPVASQPATSPASRPANELTEEEKIEALIASVAALQHAVFIRNDQEHDCKDAAKHMRDKWRWKSREIKSAADFIRIAASKSSTSGKPYKIKFKDGSLIESGKYLMNLLLTMESASASQPTSARALP